MIEKKFESKLKISYKLKHDIVVASIEKITIIIYLFSNPVVVNP